MQVSGISGNDFRLVTREVSNNFNASFARRASDIKGPGVVELNPKTQNVNRNYEIAALKFLTSKVAKQHGVV